MYGTPGGSKTKVAVSWELCSSGTYDRITRTYEHRFCLLTNFIVEKIGNFVEGRVVSNVGEYFHGGQCEESQSEPGFITSTLGHQNMLVVREDFGACFAIGPVHLVKQYFNASHRLSRPYYQRLSKLIKHSTIV